jgi:hypothetical protein
MSDFPKCPGCGLTCEPSIDKSVPPHPMHGYKKNCGNCGRMIGWTGKGENKARRPAKHRKLVKASGLDTANSV